MTSAPSTSAAHAAAPPSGDGRLGYLPGIDGLRALSVLVVVLYHADVTALSGGFLGVEVFFVISGYLITTLLLGERERTGSLSLRGFWTRRARRLLPALYALLVGVVLLAVAFAPDALSQLRGDVVAALLYISNWWQILHQESYFVAAARPPLLRHLWSLAVEEQFYILWPVVLGLVGSRLRRGWLFLGCIAGATASLVWMAILFDPAADPSRAYFGTDTRLSGLLVGAAMAAVWPATRFEARRAGRSAGPVLDLAGVAALAVLIWSFLQVNEFDPFVYRGGFAVVDVATAVALAAVVHPSARLGSVLGVGVLRWAGQRSYSIYLWHWPIFQLTRPDLDVDLHGTALLAPRLALTAVAAEASFRLVEQPVRNGSLRRWWLNLHDRRNRAAVRSARFAAASVLAVVGLAATLLVTVPDRATDLASRATSAADLEVVDAAADPGLPADGPPAAPAEEPAGAAPVAGEVPPRPSESTHTSGAVALPTVVPLPVPTGPPVTGIGPVTAVGDSVMLDAVGRLREQIPEVAVNAKVSRQFDEAVDLIRILGAQGKLGQTIIVHLGTNGTFNRGQFRALMVAAGGRLVVFINAKVPRPWEALTNQRLSEEVPLWPNAKLGDWHALASTHPEFFVEDGVHLNPVGAQAYAQFLAAQLR